MALFFCSLFRNTKNITIVVRIILNLKCVHLISTNKI